MWRLDAGGDPKRAKPWHIGPVDKLDMLDPVPAIPDTIAFSGCFIAVDGLAHRAIANGVDRDL